MDKKTLDIRAVENTGGNTGDAPILPHLLNQPEHRQPDPEAAVFGYSVGPVAFILIGPVTYKDQPPPVPSPGMIRSACGNIRAGHCGGTGIDTTEESASGYEDDPERFWGLFSRRVDGSHEAGGTVPYDTGFSPAGRGPERPYPSWYACRDSGGIDRSGGKEKTVRQLVCFNAQTDRAAIVSRCRGDGAN